MQTPLEKLNQAPPPGDQLVPYLSSLTDDLDQLAQPAQAFPYIFNFFESRPEDDLGMPGPLVHWLEGHFPDFLDDLHDSLRRRPTYHTVWMASRILHAEVDPTLHRQMVRLLSDAIQHPEADDLCVETARQFLSLHLEKASSHH